LSPIFVGSNFQFFKLLLIDYKDYLKNNIVISLVKKL
jgi:hypothetical protein